VMKYIDRDLYPQTQRLEKKIKADPSNVGLINNLGILYARYGVYDKAEAAFNRILKTREYVPALVNMGNIAYLKKDMNGAKKYYEKAYAKEPSNASVLLNLAKVSYELGKYDETQKYYALLAKKDSQLAGRFAYLSMKGSNDTARAADVERMKEEMVWDE
jgi:Flp pilus assembly protein TadD